MSCQTERVELDCHQLAAALLLHADTVEDLGDLDGSLVVGDQQELGALGQLLHDLVEAPDVGVVQGGVHLVQQKER